MNRSSPSVPAWLVLPALLLACPLSPAQDRPRTLTGRDTTLRISEPDEHDLELRMTPVVRAVQKSADSVVSIYIVDRNTLAGRRGLPEGQGSGVILDEQGFVITNWHVAYPALDNPGVYLQARLKDGRSYRARVLSVSPEHDLALLQLELGAGERVQPIEIGTSEGLMVGETVIAIGNPQGHANTVTAGVLSQIGREIQVMGPDRRPHKYTGLLQTDAAINQGNSGGALLDITGRLIGINNAMAVGVENIGFAIPVDTVRKVFEDELLSSNNLAVTGSTPWLGLDVAERQGRLMVVKVDPFGPAAEAGLRPGDELVQMDDAPLRSRMDYARHLFTVRAGRPLDLVVRRGGRSLELHPVPRTRLAMALAALAGIELEEVTARDDPALVRRATEMFYRNYRGRVPLLPVVLRVERVLPDGPAEAIGMRKGDVILGVLGTNRWGEEIEIRLDSATELAQYLARAAGSELGVLVMRGDQDLVGTLDVRRLPR